MRLIDANEIVGKLKNTMINPQTVFINTVLLGLIDEAPTVDAETRVRCEKCVSSGGDAFGEMICQNQLCPCCGREVDHAFSCVLGERRTDGKDT